MVRRVATVSGVVFLLVGLLGISATNGFSMIANPAPTAVLGLFGVNLPHNIVHILFGVWGLVASRSLASAKQFAQVGGVIYLGLAILGLVEPTMYGLIPIGGHDIWLHALLGGALAGVGFGGNALTL